MRGSGVPEGAQSNVKATARGTGVPEGAQRVITDQTVHMSDESFDKGLRQAVDNVLDVSGETPYRSGGCATTEPSGNVQQTGEVSNVRPVHQSEESNQRAKTTSVGHGPGQGIPLDSNLNTDVSVANSRGRRAAKVPSRLIVGDPKGWHFNRAKGR